MFSSRGNVDLSITIAVLVGWTFIGNATPNQDTLICSLVRQGDYHSLVRAIRTQHASFHIVCPGGELRTPLEVACDILRLSTPILKPSQQRQYQKIIRFLVQQYIATNQWNTRFNGNQTLLHLAVFGEDPRQIRHLLTLSLSPNAQDDFGFTPLHNACLIGNLPIARILIQYGAQIQTNVMDVTPLHWAVVGGNRKIVQLLLAHGANPLAKDFAGYTPLRFAFFFQRDAIAQDLVQRLFLQGFQDWNLDLGEGLTIIHLIAYAGNLPYLTLLIQQNVNLRVTDYYGRTPLHCAALSRQPRALAILLSQMDTSLVNAQDSFGATPLHYVAAVARRPHPKIVRLLLEQGANPQIPDAEGKIPCQRLTSRLQQANTEPYPRRLRKIYKLLRCRTTSLSTPSPPY